MKKIMYPDYNNSLLNVASSVLAHYNIEPSHSVLPYLDYHLNWNFRNVVVMVFDGLGTCILERHLKKETFLRQNNVLNISSVFPPTTAAATTTLHTGLSPLEHGWLGWSLWFDEIGKHVDLFTNKISGTDIQAADYSAAHKYLPYNGILEQIAATGVNVDFIAHKDITGVISKAGNVAELCGKVRANCGGTRQSPGKNFMVAYWQDPDSTIHEHGTASEQAAAVIEEINRETQRLAAELKGTDTLLIITADHGLTDVEWKYVSDYPSLAECLVRPVSIEPRAANFFVKPDKKERFAAEFYEIFGDEFMLLTKERILERGFFGVLGAAFRRHPGAAPPKGGAGQPHKMIDRLLGDYIAVGVGKTAIANGRTADGPPFKAHHAGLTEEEMLVPLIVAEMT